MYSSPKYKKLELEVDERATVRAHELVNYEDDERRAEDHEREGLRGEHDAVAALPFLGDPVDEHACDKHEDDVDVFPRDGAERVPAPGGTHLVHHVFGRIPGDFVCFGGVEVRACAEEESRKRDEHEGERHVPGHIQPVVCLLAEEAENHHGEYAGEKHAEPDCGYGADGEVEVLVDNRAHGKEEECCGGAEGDAALAPDFIEHLAETVEAAPDDEVPAGTVPPAAYDLRGHGVHVGGDELAGIRFEVGVD